MFGLGVSRHRTLGFRFILALITEMNNVLMFGLDVIGKFSFVSGLIVTLITGIAISVMNIIDVFREVCCCSSAVLTEFAKEPQSFMLDSMMLLQLIRCTGFKITLFTTNSLDLMH